MICETTSTRLAGSLNRYPATIVEVVGHTDNTGDAAYNMRLSQQRARSVAAILVWAGVPQSRVIATGRGERSADRVEPDTRRASGQPPGRIHHTRPSVIIAKQSIEGRVVPAFFCRTSLCDRQAFSPQASGVITPKHPGLTVRVFRSLARGASVQPGFNLQDRVVDHCRSIGSRHLLAQNIASGCHRD